jgi:hypothetical protein
MQTEQIDQFQFVEQMKTAASITEAAVLLYADACSILDGDLVALCYAVCSMECKGSYGTILFDHLAADGASLAGGQVTVVAVSQVDAHFLGSLHLELLHSLLSLGNIDLVVLHLRFSPFRFLRKKTLSEESFSFRKASFTRGENNMNVFKRKYAKILEGDDLLRNAG